MTYYPDMSPYSYDETCRDMLNVGWLASNHGYTKGLVDDRVVEALKILGIAYENQMRGIHHCEFCDAGRPFYLAGPDGETKVLLGSAEIRAVGGDGICYAAPNLILHYIVEHQYCPPEEFCQAAVRTAGLKASEELSVVE
ncbi:hypothetical protein [Streptomyces sp. MUM 16J]|uniref:DUF7919 family protein n=1 Tax=Streptomyces sp. MUM 16J TaxID=2791988 RepID=UPI001F03C631|nr:hypothetical protein [Streptomyces sp. MUM 16J]MCH0561409.1 hypothetical protein [Streptomyces sp. MUM 16J]